MFNRRSLLVTAAGLAATSLLGGCRAMGEAVLQIQLLEGSVPPQLLQEFQRQFEAGRVGFRASSQLAQLFDLLKAWKNPPPAPSGLPNPFSRRTPTPPPSDWLTLGDYWLTAAIQQNLIQPLDLSSVSGWGQIPSQWQTLVRRDRQGQLSESGEVWAAPYRWGSLVIAYNVKAMQQLGWVPTDWADLWRPELQGQISLPDQARSVIGLTLKKLGQSANTADLTAVANLESEMAALHRQVKFYSSDAYLQPLVLRDSWVAVGWSTEVLPVIKRDPRIAAIVPSSGTLLTSDLWVRPAPALSASSSSPASSSSSTDSPLREPASISTLNRWLEFCWQPAVATQLSTLSLAASPVLVSQDRAQLPESIRQNLVLLPPAATLERSDFILPRANDGDRQLWERVRRIG